MAHEEDLVSDAAAVEALFDEHWLTAWRAAYAVSGRDDLADDAAQDAFVVSWGYAAVAVPERQRRGARRKSGAPRRLGALASMF